MTELFKDGVDPCIVFVPNVGSRFSVGTKHDDVFECYKAIAGENTPTIKKDEIFTYVKRGEDWIRCIDLVDDESNRAEKVQAIADDHDNTDPSKRKIDVIIALGMMKEGANWRWARNEFIIGNRHSLREFVQMVGRLFRSADGKKAVTTYYLLPHSPNVKSEEYEDNFNDYMKATTSSLLLIKVYAPRLISTPVEGEVDEDAGGNTRQKRVSFIDLMITDENEQEAMLEEARDAIIAASEEFGIEVNCNNGQIRITPEQREQLKSSLDSFLDSNLVSVRGNSDWKTFLFFCSALVLECFSYSVRSS
jgi:hypothetical protein